MSAQGSVIAVGNLQEFFRESLHAALSHQKLEVNDHTEHYVVDLLTLFSRAEALYDNETERAGLKPLVMMLSEALQAPTAAERTRGLQRLGDVSLFVAGFFAGSFARKLVDIDYHIAMGGRAYGAAGTLVTRGDVPQLADIYGELAERFDAFARVIYDVREMTALRTPQDIIKLYERWKKTRSPKLAGRLAEEGVFPVDHEKDETLH